MVYNILKHIYKFIFRIPNQFRFGEFGKNSVIIRPLKIINSKSIYIGSGVHIHNFSWLAVDFSLNKNAELQIGSGSSIGHYSHIYATKKIHIGEDVLIADRVYIADNSHKFENVEIPIINQGIKQLKEVYIGSGSWIGENVCIIGSSIGKNSVIGANSVVTKDIPDYCVAVGAPARVIKKYNLKNKSWEKIY